MNLILRGIQRLLFCRTWMSGGDVEQERGRVQGVLYMVTIFAVIPLAVALVLMTLFQRNSRQAGLVTLVLVCTMTGVVPAFHLSPLQLLLAIGAGGATALPVLTVLFPALFLYHLQRVTGSMQIVTQHIARLTSDRDLQVLLLVLGLSPFVEALCGFGVGIIVMSPCCSSYALTLSASQS